jgi:hypothetical protein
MMEYEVEAMHAAPEYFNQTASQLFAAFLSSWKAHHPPFCAWSCHLPCLCSVSAHQTKGFMIAQHTDSAGPSQNCKEFRGYKIKQ